MDTTEQTRRIGELEDQLKQRDTRITELKAEVDEQRQLVEELREQVADSHELYESWIEAFEMVSTGNGTVTWAPWVEECESYVDRRNELVRKYNALADKYNALVQPRDPGRPIAASEEQQIQVRGLHLLEPRCSLREIAKETGLGIRTIRTIIGKIDGTDRTSVKRAKLRRMELNKAKQASWRARKRTRDALPDRIAELQAKSEELLKRAGVSRAR
jgi:transposase/uncharacterized coiled-coil protein SlyX